MRILIATNRPAAFAVFLAALKRLDQETSLVPTGQAALAQARLHPPTLCVVDDGLPDMTAFALVAGLMRENAGIHTAVVSELSPEAFHEAGEGLGILLTLPRQPGAAEAEALLGALTAVA